MPWLIDSGAIGIALASLLVACGGTAIFDGQPGEGTDTDTTTSDPATDVTFTTTTMTTTTTPVGDLCDQACATGVACSVDPATCGTGCDLANSSDACGGLHQAWLGCAIEVDGDICGGNAGIECRSLLVEFLACRGTRLNTLGCTTSPDDGSCTCEGETASLGELSVVCSVDGNACTCIQDGIVLGTCEREPDCNLVDNCCASVVFSGAVFVRER
ncbi:MAG: hypothetical protein AAGA56_23260 [Myxococcota bacterium]